ncbi:YbaK/EbsC family protein [Desulfovibrio sp. OttesenSCG-928-O18]|nr:YbaK/EbsC family protein [Desulfovibrio sp. OttesenSCG-928-O18]
MSVATVKEYLKEWGKDADVREFTQSSATVALAAAALGVEPARIAKSLSFKLEPGCVLIVAAGDARIVSSKYKAFFGKKAVMPKPEETLELTGHPVGGVCPFAVTPEVRTYLDVSLKRFNTVFPACGSANSAVEMTPDELFVCARAVDWVDICSGWNDA